MHPADIKAALEKAGSSQSRVARAVRGRSGEMVTPGAVHLVVKGTTKSAAIAKQISKITGKRVAELWPGKYPELEFVERTQLKRTAPAAPAKKAEAKASSKAAPRERIA